MHRMPVGAALVVAAIIWALAVVIGPHRASAFPSTQKDCSQCHGVAGVFPNTVTATPSASVLTPGQSYRVAIAMNPPVAGASGTGFCIANSDAGGATGATTNVFAGGAGQGTSGQWSVTVAAPSMPGVHFYKVFGQSGPFGATGAPGFALYGIEVASPVPSATVTMGAPTATGSVEPGTPTPTPSPTATTAASPCIVSCNGQPDVTVDQVVVGMNILRGAADRSVCSNLDMNGDTQVTFDELVFALDAGLRGCPPEPPNPPAATVTPTVSAVASGEELYVAYCAACHEPSSPGYVGTEVYGESAHDISEAVADVTAMRSLAGLLSTDEIARIAAYLGTLDGGDEHNTVRE